MRPGSRSLSVLAGVVLLAARVAAQTDPLPSWNDGAAKQSILKFVADTTTAGAPGFVAPAERIATFDNDGTLWAEQPLYFQVAFALDRVKAMAPQHPEWKDQEPFKTLLTGDVKGALGQGEKAILEVVAAAHSGMTTEEFRATVTEWIGSAKHPRSGRLYTEMVYQPMLELLACLRANGFKTFILSGGASSSCDRGPRRRMGSPPSRWWAAAGSRSSRCVPPDRFW